MKPELYKSRWILHAKGYNPYRGKIQNFPLHLTIWLYRQFAQRTGLIKGNQGPWGDWQATQNSKTWRDKQRIYLPIIEDFFNSKDELHPEDLANQHHSFLNNLVQSGYIIHKTDAIHT